MKRVQSAVLIGQVLSYLLIITFVFADAIFDFTGVLRVDGRALSLPLAWVAACLISLVGAINIWLTWHYIDKAHTMREWVIVCAWTHRIKQGGRWVSLEDFLTEHLGYEVSHGLSDAAYLKLRDEIDEKWEDNRIDAREASRQVCRPEEPRKPPCDNAAPASEAC